MAVERNSAAHAGRRESKPFLPRHYTPLPETVFPAKESGKNRLVTMRRIGFLQGGRENNELTSIQKEKLYKLQYERMDEIYANKDWYGMQESGLTGEQEWHAKEIRYQIEQGKRPAPGM